MKTTDNAERLSWDGFRAVVQVDCDDEATCTFERDDGTKRVITIDRWRTELVPGVPIIAADRWGWATSTHGRVPCVVPAVWQV